MNYFQRLVRRALAQQKTTGPVLFDPFAETTLWPLDPVSPVPTTQRLTPVPPAVQPGAKGANEQTGPIPLTASPAQNLSPASLSHGRGYANAPETPPSNPKSGAPSERPHPAPLSMAAPPSMTESLRPAAPETTMAADPLLAAADAFMAQFEGLGGRISAQPPILPATGIPAQPSNQWSAPMPQDTTPPSLQPTPPARATLPPAAEQHAGVPAPRTPPVSNTAPAPPGSPARVATDTAPVQVLVVEPQSVHGPASRLGSGAPHLGLGQL